jgi:hypothetical protein
MAYNQLKNKKGSISDDRLMKISCEIKAGKSEFKPLNSYKIPKKTVKLNKSSVKKYLKNKISKEKLQFYKDMKAKKRHTRVATEYRQIFEENLEGKIVAKAIQIVHIIRNRKQVTLCFKCHCEAHNGSINSDIITRAIKILKKLL